jgi:stringent starvation protein B
MTEPLSQKPYLLRALYEWCVDNGFTPYVSVVVDSETRVPMEYVRNGEIVLNIGPLAANRLKMGNEFIEFAARFGGVAKDLLIPIGAVSAIYARENGHGMSFEVERRSKPGWEVAGHPLRDATARRAGPEDEPRAADIAAPPVTRGEGEGGGAGRSGAEGSSSTASSGASGDGPKPPGATPTPGSGRPALRRVK